MKLKLTEAQQAAVKERGGILVSAAAGSGKTAVLVQRIIDSLTRDDNPISADRILVVTFTNSAAKEMRERLEKGIDAYCRENPHNKSAARQKLLLQSAAICTIDSYCISMVRENFDKLNIDIDFKIAENNELEKIREDAITTVFEKYFACENKVFYSLLDALGAVYDESNLTDAVKRICEVAQNMPFPYVWLDNMRKRYSGEAFALWREEALKQAYDYTNRALRYITAADKYFLVNEKLKGAYCSSFKSAEEKIQKILCSIENEDWDKTYSLLCEFKFDKFSAYKGSGEDNNAICVKELRDFAKKQIEKASSLIYDKEETVKAHFNTTAPLNTMLVTLAEEYYTCLKDELTKKGIFTFNDIEHMAFELMCEYKNGGICLKETANEFISNYDEIFVDEYQDVNDLQDKFFYFLSDMGKKLFVVGDVKQSIYGFRGANPENFLNKQNIAVNYQYAQEDDIKSIILDSNFRSKDEICQCVNFIFDRIMTKQFCGIDYKISERLSPKAVFPSTDVPAAQIHMVDTCGENEKQAEAAHIADYILDVMNSGEVIKDKDTGRLRKARFSDFAVLVRYLKPVSDIIVKEFNKRGIPISYTKEGFLESKEIKIMLSLLSVIDNPTLEVELLSVLMSPIFGFTPDDMAQIRIARPKVNLYSALVFCAENGNKKCNYFISFISGLRKCAAIMPLSKLIAHIYEVTDFMSIISLMDNSQLRLANLNYLSELASSYENTGNHSITAFKKNLQRLSDGKLKGATLSGGSDCVQLVTIHYSKGLQYPVCIVAFTGSPFNSIDQKQALVIDPEYGVSFKFYNEEEGGVLPIDKRLLAEFSRKRQLKEELRMLYVAATRAEDILVITVAKKSPQSALSKMAVKLEAAGDEITEDIYSTANSYADWILPCMLLHSDAGVFSEIADYRAEVEEISGRIYMDIYSPTEEAVTEEQDIQTVDETAVLKIKERICYEYPYDILRRVESKSSVSDMVHKAEKGDYDFTCRPGFLDDTGLSPTQRGTAVHKIMQYMDFNKVREDFDGEIERLKEWEYITETEARVDTEHIRRFIKSSLFDRMCASKDLRREMKFLTFMPITDIEKNIPAHLNNEQIVVQGAVDCMFVEDGGIVIVDFKTDRVKEEEQLISSYAEQLNIYAMACEKITGLPIKEKIIYSLVLDRSIVV